MESNGVTLQTPQRAQRPIPFVVVGLFLIPVIIFAVLDSLLLEVLGLSSALPMIVQHALIILGVAIVILVGYGLIIGDRGKRLWHYVILAVSMTIVCYPMGVFMLKLIFAAPR